MVAIAVIVLFANPTNMLGLSVSSVDPGPLSAGHAHFIGQENCGACHVAHEKGAAGWWQAAVTGIKADAAGQEVSKSCSDCHGFNGLDQQAHNQTFPERTDLGQTNCLMCHTEHQGITVAKSSITDRQCQTCHEQRIDDFAKDHPPFPPGFPHDHAKGIKFDHGTHLAKHFLDQTLAPLVPKGNCIGCHQVETAARTVQPAGFDVSCAGCHESAIVNSEFVLFRWPEIESSSITAEDVAEACGLSTEAAEELANELSDGEFSPISVDSPTAIQSLLMGTSIDDMADFAPRVQDIAESAILEGSDPLVALSEDRFGEGAGTKLLSGLNDEQVRQAFCAWAANQEYEQTGSNNLPGWKADFLDLRYVSPRHADPVLKAWIDSVATMKTPEDADEADRLLQARDELLAVDGPGRCLKCHSATEGPSGSISVAWSHTLGAPRALTKFDHNPHVNLLGPDKSCTNCHALDTTTKDKGIAFKPVSVAGCAECHATERLRDDCLLCHVFHQEHTLKKGMMADAE